MFHHLNDKLDDKIKFDVTQKSLTHLEFEAFHGRYFIKNKNLRKI